MSLEISSRMEAVGREFRRHSKAYIVVGCFALAGPLVTHFIFPEAPRFSGAFGGVCLGIYAALCAIPDQFIDES